MATYYMRADGTAVNKAAATSDSAASTSMSISTHNGESFSAGDTIVISDNGGEYRGTILTVPSDGSDGSPITYQNSGSPDMRGSALITGWTNYSGNVWQATVSTEPNQVWVDGTFGDPQTSIGACVNNYDWYWSSSTLYLYDSSGDPDNRSSPGVEADELNDVFRLNGKDYIVIDGLTIRHSFRSGIRAWPQSEYATVKNCTVEWCWQRGIEGNQSNYDADCYGWEIYDNTCRYCGEHGITGAVRANGWNVYRNTCYENGTYNPTSSYTAGIKFWGNHLYTINCEIYENVCYSNGGVGGVGSGDGVGIWLDAVGFSAGNENIVRHNLCYSNHSYGIFVEISERNIAHHNICYDNATENYTSNIAIKAWNPYPAKYNEIYNNVAYGSNSWGIECQGWNGGSNCCSYNKWYNNIVDGSSSQELYLNNGGDNDGSEGTGNEYKYNSFGEDYNYMIQVAGTDYHSVASFESAVTGASDNLSDEDPLFTAPGSNDFTLQGDSPCIGAGTVTSYSTGLLPGSTWPDGVQTGDQDSY